jgi:methyl-accepting chemotaxis protein
MIKQAGTKKRRKYFLKNSSQPVLILKIYLILLVVMLLSGAVFYFIGNRNLTQEFFQAHSVIKTTMQLLLPALILVNVIGLLGVSFLVVAFTHSIAGPIYRLKDLSEKIAAGDLTVEIRFRRKDTIQELSVVINRLINGLNSRLRQLKESLYKLQKFSTKIEDLDKLSPSELINLKDTFLSVSAELKEKIEKFKIDK